MNKRELLILGALILFGIGVIAYQNHRQYLLDKDRVLLNDYTEKCEALRKELLDMKEERAWAVQTFSSLNNVIDQLKAQKERLTGDIYLLRKETKESSDE